MFPLALRILGVSPSLHFVELPYSGKLSREKNFRVFRGFRTIQKVFSAKFCNQQCAHCMYAGALRMCEGHTYIIIGPEQSAKVFSAKFSFWTETRKFFPSKVFRYKVYFTSHNNNTSKILYLMIISSKFDPLCIPEALNLLLWKTTM